MGGHGRSLVILQPKPLELTKSSRKKKKENKKDISHIMSGSVRAEEGPTYMRGSSVDHRRSEKDKANIRTHIYRIQH